MDGSSYIVKESSSYIGPSPTNPTTQLGEFKTHSMDFDRLPSFEGVPGVNNSFRVNPHLSGFSTHHFVEPNALLPSTHPEYYSHPFSSFPSYSPFPEYTQECCYPDSSFYHSYPSAYPSASYSIHYNEYNNIYSVQPYNQMVSPGYQPVRHVTSNLSAKSQPFSSRAHSRRDEENVLDIEKVKRGEDKRTTLMIRNIPNGYTRDAFVKIINATCKNLYDFLYLPIDQDTHCNMGYGYVNMISLDAVVLMYENFNNRKWPHTKSSKICSICYGRLQSGNEDLMHYCSDWSVMTSDEKYHPLFFKPKKTIVNGKEITEMVPSKPQIDYSMRGN